MPEPITLTAAEQKELQRTARRSPGWVCERLHYVRLFARGLPVAAIALLYQVDERTVSTWLERYQEGGGAALADHPRSGRPRLAGPAAQAEARGCLEAAPDCQGVARTTWTRRLLGRHLEERLGCWLSMSSLTRLLRRLDFVWRRPKLATKGAAPRAAAGEPSLQAVLAQYPEAPRLYGDACDVHQLPVVRGQYQRRGQQRTIPTPGQNKKQPLFGFVNVVTGQFHYWLTQRKRSVDFIGCLHELAKLYPGGMILLFLDNASIHKSALTLAWLQRHPRLLVFYLPAYSGHKTNPVEKIWWELKAECAANHLYASLEAVQEAIHGFFAGLSCARVRQLIARKVPPDHAVFPPVSRPAKRAKRETVAVA